MDLGRRQHRPDQLDPGALGIVLGLGLVETVLIVVLGNLVGCAIFAAMTVMGHKTGVNQMVLSRSAFGRRGGYLSSWIQFLMTMGWIGVNTYFPVILAVAILGLRRRGHLLVKFLVVTVIMIIQVGIGVYGFYLIRTFEKYTVPVTAAILVLMSILAWSRDGVVDWGLTTKLTGAAHFSAITGLVTAIGVGWGISWVTWASDYSRFVPADLLQVGVLVQLCRDVRPHGVAGDPGRVHRQCQPVHRPGEAGDVGVRRRRRRAGMLLVLHGPIATNILNVYSSALAAASAGIRASRFALGLLAGAVGYAVTLYFLGAPSFAQTFDNWMVGLILWMSPWAGWCWPTSTCSGGSGSTSTSSMRSPNRALWGRQLGRDRCLRHRARRRLAVRVRPGGAPPGLRVQEPPQRRRPVVAGRPRGRRRRLPGRDAAGRGPGTGDGGAPVADS